MDGRRSLLEYREAVARWSHDRNTSSTSCEALQAGRDSCWMKQKFGTLKVNTDAAWCKESLTAGLGWVVRDFVGVLQAAGGSGKSRFHSAAAAEAAAIRGALFFCLQKNFDSVIIESDAKSIVQMIRKEVSRDFRIDCLISDIEVLARSLKYVTFSSVPRESNNAAHSVAKFVLGKDSDFTWDAIGPEFLFNILARDVNLSIRI